VGPEAPVSCLGALVRLFSMYAEALGQAIVGGMSAVCARVLPYEDDLPQGGQEGAPRKD
jgi:hypothetical protein